MTHQCPPTCHWCPDLDDYVMPGCMGTAALATDHKSLDYCTCAANLELPTEATLEARIAILEARVAELEQRT